ncbi:MAG: 30S ribosomal protein S4 [bacterium]|nr:30S ribosomal protein S4 [bacterium]
MGFDTREKLERALGERLNLKPFRSLSAKSSVAKRPYRPGVHGKNRRRVTEYGKQLAEKQKFRVSYGLSEKQMRSYFKKASHSGQNTGEALMSLLERRLDNIVFRLGLAPSRSMARQLVSHGHVSVNGRKVTTPSRIMKLGEMVGIRKGSENHPVLISAKEGIAKYNRPNWLQLDVAKMEGSIAVRPKELEIPFDISLLVDYYSKTVK